MVLMSFIKCSGGQSYVSFLDFTPSFTANVFDSCLVYCALLLAFSSYWAGVGSARALILYNRRFLSKNLFVVSSDYLLNIGSGSVTNFDSVLIK